MAPASVGGGAYWRREALQQQALFITSPARTVCRQCRRIICTRANTLCGAYLTVPWRQMPLIFAAPFHLLHLTLSEAHFLLSYIRRYTLLPSCGTKRKTNITQNQKRM